MGCSAPREHGLGRRNATIGCAPRRTSVVAPHDPRVGFGVCGRGFRRTTWKRGFAAHDGRASVCSARHASISRALRRTRVACASRRTRVGCAALHTRVGWAALRAKRGLRRTACRPWVASHDALHRFADFPADIAARRSLTSAAEVTARLRLVSAPALTREPRLLRVALHRDLLTEKNPRPRRGRRKEDLPAGINTRGASAFRAADDARSTSYLRAGVDVRSTFSAARRHRSIRAAAASDPLGTRDSCCPLRGARTPSPARRR